MFVPVSVAPLPGQLPVNALHVGDAGAILGSWLWAGSTLAFD